MIIPNRLGFSLSISTLTYWSVGGAWWTLFRILSTNSRLFDAKIPIWSPGLYCISLDKPWVLSSTQSVFLLQLINLKIIFHLKCLFFKLNIYSKDPDRRFFLLTSLHGSIVLLWTLLNDSHMTGLCLSSIRVNLTLCWLQPKSSFDDIESMNDLSESMQKASMADLKIKQLNKKTNLFI